MIEVEVGNREIPDVIFYMLLKQGLETVGLLLVLPHKNDPVGAEVDLEIIPELRGKWLSRSLKNRMLDTLVTMSKKCNIKILYSTALTEVSARLLRFFGFINYYKEEPETYYYLEV